MATRRKKIPSSVEQDVLFKSKRRCALCFHLLGKSSPEIGQIATLDISAGNVSEDNLVFLCLDHHAQYDSKSSGGKNFTVQEVRAARSELYSAVKKEESQYSAESSDPRAFEDKVTEYIREQFIERLGDHFALHRNMILEGRSGVSYEVDIATRFRIGDLTFFTIFEVKYRRMLATPSDILEFSARMKDLGADKGVFVSATGLSAGAARLARANGISVIQQNPSSGALEPVIAKDDRDEPDLRARLKNGPRKND